MVREEREPLREKVDIDDTSVGGTEAGVRERETVTRALVLVAVEVRQIRLADGGQPGKVISVAGRSRMVRRPSLDAATVIAASQPLVTPGSEIHTDGYMRFGNLTTWRVEPRASHHPRCGSEG